MRERDANASEAAQQESPGFACPFPGCSRRYAELWKLRQHHRAPERAAAGKGGHGKELEACPKCARELSPSLPHLGCLDGLAAPRQAVKRRRIQTQKEEDRSLLQTKATRFAPLTPVQPQQLRTAASLSPTHTTLLQPVESGSPNVLQSSAAGLMAQLGASLAAASRIQTPAAAAPSAAAAANLAADAKQRPPPSQQQVQKLVSAFVQAILNTQLPPPPPPAASHAHQCSGCEGCSTAAVPVSQALPLRQASTYGRIADPAACAAATEPAAADAGAFGRERSFASMLQEPASDAVPHHRTARPATADDPQVCRWLPPADDQPANDDAGQAAWAGDVSGGFHASDWLHSDMFSPHMLQQHAPPPPPPLPQQQQQQQACAWDIAPFCMPDAFFADGGSSGHSDARHFAEDMYASYTPDDIQALLADG